MRIYAKDWNPSNPLRVINRHPLRFPRDKNVPLRGLRFSKFSHFPRCENLQLELGEINGAAHQWVTGVDDDFVMEEQAVTAEARPRLGVSFFMD